MVRPFAVVTFALGTLFDAPRSALADDTTTSIPALSAPRDSGWNRRRWCTHSSWIFPPAILAHDGEAVANAKSFRTLTQDDQAAVLAFSAL
jgi:hypothetical protein